MQQVSGQTQQTLQKRYVLDPKLLSCPLCNLTLQKPITLACGHTFCHPCLIAAISRKLEENKEGRALTMIPLCPRCLSVIWRPLASLKENVVLSALVSKFYAKMREESPPVVLPTQCFAQLHILIDCASNTNTLLPHCYSQVVFATAFIDEIIEQQAQSNLVVLRWPTAPQGMAIAGRLLRPETYHYTINASRFETVYKAVFEGRYFVAVNDWQQLDLKVSGNFNDNNPSTSPLSLCQVQYLPSSNHLQMHQFAPFFDIYDKLNNPVYLRQIAQMADQKVLHERKNPERLIYCVMRLVRLSEKEVEELARMMDDQQRWLRIEDYLVRNADKPAVELIKIDIPGNYSNPLVFALFFLMIVYHYFIK